MRVAPSWPSLGKVAMPRLTVIASPLGRNFAPSVSPRSVSETSTARALFVSPIVGRELADRLEGGPLGGSPVLRQAKASQPGGQQRQGRSGQHGEGEQRLEEGHTASNDCRWRKRQPLDGGAGRREGLLVEIEAVGHVIRRLVARIDRRQAKGLLAELHQADVRVLGV